MSHPEHSPEKQMARMNPEVKARWVAALRSGEYKQGKCALRRGDRYCCLGVLCDLQDNKGWSPPLAGRERFAFGASVGLPPSFVKEWAGFVAGEYGIPLIPKVEIGGVTLDVDEHNDNGRTFAEIADAIESQL